MTWRAIERLKFHYWEHLDDGEFSGVPHRFLLHDAFVSVSDEERFVLC